MKVGFIGLGRMGQAMSARILGGGHDLVVYNRTTEKTAEIAKAGAKVAPSISELLAKGVKSSSRSWQTMRLSRRWRSMLAAYETR